MGNLRRIDDPPDRVGGRAALGLRVGALRAGGAGVNQVHGDTVGAELVREGLGQVDDRGVAEAADVARASRNVAAWGSARRCCARSWTGGATAGKPVTIHVEAYNPALGLYRRLAFEHVDTNGVYFLMRWTPPQVKTAS